MRDEANTSARRSWLANIQGKRQLRISEPTECDRRLIMQRTITINDVELQVEYSRSGYRPASFDSPSEGGDVEIEAVFLDGNNVSELLADWVMERITESLEFHLHDDLRQAKAAAEEDLAERLHEGRSMQPTPCTGSPMTTWRRWADEKVPDSGNHLSSCCLVLPGLAHVRGSEQRPQHLPDRCLSPDLLYWSCCCRIHLWPACRR